MALLVDHSLQFCEVKIKNPDAHMEVQRIRVKTSEKSWLTVTNCYIPPTSSCQNQYKPALEKILDAEDSLVLGDMNGHDELWHSSLSDKRGEDMSEIICQSSHGVLNEDSPTRVPKNGQPTSPDISLASDSILLSTEWCTATTLRSDHLPIVIRVLLEEPAKYGAPNRTFTNLAKANWDGWQKEIESALENSDRPTDVYCGESKFRYLLNKSSSHNIPSGRIPIIRPSFPSEAAKLADERDEIRKTNPASPQIEVLNQQIDEKVKGHKQSKWRDSLSTFSKHSNVGKLWKTIKTLTNGRQQDPNRSITFSGKTITNNNQIAAAFNKQFTAVCEKRSNKKSRKVNRMVRKRSLSDAPVFTTEETKKPSWNQKHQKHADQMTSLLSTLNILDPKASRT